MLIFRALTVAIHCISGSLYAHFCPLTQLEYVATPPLPLYMGQDAQSQVWLVLWYILEWPPLYHRPFLTLLNGPRSRLTM